MLHGGGQAMRVPSASSVLVLKGERRKDKEEEEKENQKLVALRVIKIR